MLKMSAKLLILWAFALSLGALASTGNSSDLRADSIAYLVELAGQKWRVVAGVEHQGEAMGRGGHYVAYGRRGSKWLYMSDSACQEVKSLPVGKLYGILLEARE